MPVARENLEKRKQKENQSGLRANRTFSDHRDDDKRRKKDGSGMN